MIIFKKDFSNASFSVYDEKPDFDLFRVEQVHGSEVVETPSAFVPADGLCNRNFRVPHKMGVLTADCIPLFIIGKDGYALLHAGWKGIQKEITSHQLIKKINPITFFIGPHIQVCCYEVDENFRKNFMDSNSFLVQDKKLFFDLGKELGSQLVSKYPKVKVEYCRVCTCCDQTFHSFRRDKTEKRNWNVVELKE